MIAAVKSLPALDKCPSCGCPAGRDEAAGCLGARLLTAQLESESALDQLGKARSAMFAAALLALASGVVELVNAQGNGVRLVVGIVMLVLAGGYVAIGCNVRQIPAGAFGCGAGRERIFPERCFRGGDRRCHGAERLVCCAVYESRCPGAGTPGQTRKTEIRCTERSI
ncbi:MAG: hypothetical protein ACLUQ6_01570 [Alistipes onderdonkii]